MQHLIPTSQIANVGLGVSAGAGMAAFINDNATLITIGISLAGLVLAIIFYIANFIINLARLRYQQAKSLDEISKLAWKNVGKNGITSSEASAISMLAKKLKPDDSD